MRLTFEQATLLGVIEAAERGYAVSVAVKASALARWYYKRSQQASNSASRENFIAAMQSQVGKARFYFRIARRLPELRRAFNGAIAMYPKRQRENKMAAFLQVLLETGTTYQGDDNG
jgi:hypothetical protein